jgi:uncharacterized protein
MGYSARNFIRLFLGLFVCAFGIVLTIHADLGLSPWEAFHHGLSKNLDITMGQASISVGIIIIIIDIMLGENFGVGTILNMILIGIFMDILMLNNIIPVSSNIVTGFVMIFLGMFVIGVGCVLYIGAGYGSGPRDGMMIALQKRTNKSIRIIKTSIELFALIFGYLLGGSIGIGTIITTICFGLFMQYAFDICKFDITRVKHRYIINDIKYIKYKVLNKSYETCMTKNLDEGIDE